ncbi:ABC transporter ATP-binding protein [Streptomyces sp. GQFP]|uniref:ABC transporter ATP-binding protein n=1 Tax=Streptomyces sp. GQFP TaxID=2907545 RepID=UPI001F2231B3|nr:ABC transporter ATP-binding protein [Streptomyces sp. GQFP]UIX29264.1 ABC transporter ATP-binding protein [Streptomyces sp. GQFP]
MSTNTGVSATHLDRTPATAVPVLEARDIGMRFGGVTALQGVDLTVMPGAVTGLVGPNGAGKTTMFAVLSGLLRTATGTVVLGGHDVTSATPQARARLGLARTFQQPELFLGLSVREHLVLAYRARHARARLWTDAFTGGALRRPDPKEQQRVDSLLETLMLVDVAHHPVGSLPLGTSRLVEVGRALATSPTALLLDEPLAGLDTYEVARLAQALQRAVAEEGTGMLLVEHDVAMVLSLCRHIYVLDFGELIAQGTPAEIRTDPQVKAAYLGDEEFDRGEQS